MVVQNLFKSQILNWHPAIMLALAIGGHPLWADLNSGVSAFHRGDYEIAEMELRPLAERGHAKAELLLGVLYWHGWGVQKDKIKARSWLQKSAEHGDGDAECTLATTYTEEFIEAYNTGTNPGLSSALREEISWHRAAATHGAVTSQWVLCAIYLGEFMYQSQQDYAEAYPWCLKAARNTHQDLCNPQPDSFPRSSAGVSGLMAQDRLGMILRERIRRSARLLGSYEVVSDRC